MSEGEEQTTTTKVNIRGTVTSDIVGLVQDFLKTIQQVGYYEQVFGGKAGFLDSTWSMLEDFTALGTALEAEGQIQILRSELEAQLDVVKLGLEAGVWGGMGSTFASLAEKWMGTGHLLSSYKGLAINTALVPRLQRRYNRYWRPTYPSFRTAFQLWMRGWMKEEEMRKAGAYEGWPDKWMDGMIDIWDRDPSFIEAFYMWRKDLVGEEEIYNRMREDGYRDFWDKPLLNNLWYVPTLYDLCRLADYVELPETWTVKQLKSRGMKDEDIAMVYPMLQSRYLREEQRLLSNKWLWRRRFGLCTEGELEDALIRLGFKAKEREYLMEKAEMDYEDELNEEQRNVCTARYRSGLITYDEYIQCLEDTGMAHEKSNLMADYEQASGYMGYY